MNDEKEPVWFVTGCSTGFGREIVRHTLDRGYRVVATSRNLKDIENLGNDAANRICRLKLDVTCPDEITSAVTAVRSASGTSMYWSIMLASVISALLKRAIKMMCGVCLKSISGGWPI
jgi:Short-chain alcohol dehydrogenase of unknown specificity